MDVATGLPIGYRGGGAGAQCIGSSSDAHLKIDKYIVNVCKTQEL